MASAAQIKNLINQFLNPPRGPWKNWPAEQATKDIAATEKAKRRIQELEHSRSLEDELITPTSEDKIPTSATKPIGLDDPVEPDIPSYYGDTQVEKSQPDFMIELLERMENDPDLAKVTKGTMPDLDDIAEEIGTTTPNPKSYLEIKRQRDINKNTLETGIWPSGGRVKEEHVEGLKSRIKFADKKLKEAGTAVGNPKLTDEGPNVFGETAGPVDKSGIRKPTPDTRKRDPKGALAKYESTEAYDFPAMQVARGQKIAQQLPPGQAKYAGPVNVYKSQQSPKPKGRDDDDVTSREMANELSVESDPNVIRKMQDLDVMGDEHEQMLNQVREWYREWIKRTGKNKPDVERDREVIEDFVNRAATARQSDELGKTAFGKNWRVEEPYEPVRKSELKTPLSIQNLKATVRQAPRTKQEAQRGRVAGQPVTEQEIAEFLGRVDKEMGRPVNLKLKERATEEPKLLPMDLDKWPRATPEELSDLLDELLYGSVGQGERQTATLNQLRELYKQAKASGDSRLLQAIEDAAAQVKRGGGLGIQSIESQVAKPKLTQGPSRTMDELSRQRRIEAQQGPVEPQQLEMLPREQYLQAISNMLKAQGK